MKISSLLTNPWARAVVWCLLVLTALVLPIYALGYDWRQTDNCAPELTASDIQKARSVALFTWGCTLTGLALAIWIALRLLGVSGKSVWATFAVWKAIALWFAMIVTPNCFESYTYLNDRGHPLEEQVALATLVCWLGLLGAILLRAATARRLGDQEN